MFSCCLQFGFGTTGKAREKTSAFTRIGRTQPLGLAGRCAHVRLSKTADYLIDNLDIVILSRVKE